MLWDNGLHNWHLTPKPQRFSAKDHKKDSNHGLKIRWRLGDTIVRQKNNQNTTRTIANKEKQEQSKIRQRRASNDSFYRLFYPEKTR